MKPIYIDKKRLLQSDQTGCTGLPKVLCLVGYSGSGKTTVAVGLIGALRRRGLKVGTIKHDVHGFEMDQPGKDSWRHKQAGAATTIITSPKQIGMVMNVDHDHQPLELLPLMAGLDFVLVEGFKQTDLPKIEVFRTGNNKPPACKGDPSLLAVVSDASVDWGLPRYAQNDFEGIADFICQRLFLRSLNETFYSQAAC